MSAQVWTVIVAAGRSERYGRPKLLDALGDARVIDHSVAAAREACDGVVLVTDDPEVSKGQSVDAVVRGGTTRSESVRSGLAAVPEGVEFVLVHDGARPGASVALFTRVIEMLRSTDADAVVPAVPVVDTVKRVDVDGVVETTVDRTQLVAAQTPQGFRRGGLAAAHAAGGEATDDAALIEEVGGTVVVVSGDVLNRKITTPLDLDVMRAMWKFRDVEREQ